MTLHHIFMLIPLWFAVPEPLVKWTSSAYEGVRVGLTEQDTLVEQCVKSGLEVQYRFEIRLCRRRSGWVDACTDERVEVHTIQLDPVNQDFKIEVDRKGDNKDPLIMRITSFEQAVRAASSIADMPLTFIAQRDDRYLRNKRTYVDVRVFSSCEGKYNKTLTRIANFLTLGLVKMGRFDTGWVNFDLNQKER